MSSGTTIAEVKDLAKRDILRPATREAEACTCPRLSARLLQCDPSKLIYDRSTVSLRVSLTVGSCPFLALVRCLLILIDGLFGSVGCLFPMGGCIALHRGIY